MQRSRLARWCASTQSFSRRRRASARTPWSLACLVRSCSQAPRKCGRRSSALLMQEVWTFRLGLVPVRFTMWVQRRGRSTLPPPMQNGDTAAAFTNQQSSWRQEERCFALRQMWCARATGMQQRRPTRALWNPWHAMPSLTSRRTARAKVRPGDQRQVGRRCVWSGERRQP